VAFEVRREGQRGQLTESDIRMTSAGNGFII